MTDELKRLHQSVSHDVEVALREAYRLGCNAGLANKLTEGTFEWAMQQMRQGRVVKRRSCGIRLWIRDGQMAGSHPVALHDMVMTDWEIIPEPKREPEGHDFMWAAEQMRQGRRVRRKGWGMWPALITGQFVSVADADQKDWILEPEGESR